MITMKRYLYGDSLEKFLASSDEQILGSLTKANGYDLAATQCDAWLEQIAILRRTFCDSPLVGHVYFEYSIPRLGRRIDVVLVLNDVVFVLEFKVGAKSFHRAAVDQVWDYGLDLKNFHETSHNKILIPILIASGVTAATQELVEPPHEDGLTPPCLVGPESLRNVVFDALERFGNQTDENHDWESGRYSPTPTIVEAAQALYAGHNVKDITRSDAEAANLAITANRVHDVIVKARNHNRKAICFVTGVPGAGKTLVGLDVATKHTSKEDELHSVYLSGNGPLVAVLREALAADKVQRERTFGRKLKLGVARSEVQMFIQNVHHFRDDCIADSDQPPLERVAIFDEAQRAWTLEQTTRFMQQKKGLAGFAQSEPEFLISCMDRHSDWSVVVCLVGGGQEINTGEAGIQEWIDAVNRSFPHWDVYISSQLMDSEYGTGVAIQAAKQHARLQIIDDLHLAVSMRSFRAEHVSQFVKFLLDGDVDNAACTYRQFGDKYPIALTRNTEVAKEWLRDRARGTERFGLLASSNAFRLKPHAMDVRVKTDPVHWFLKPKEDVRSSYYLEDVATEFQVQGLELDWTCVTWDGDLRRTPDCWNHFSFSGSQWKRVRKEERQRYLLNAYRVLLTRARQGMVIVVPEGSPTDPTRSPKFYDPTFEYFEAAGLDVIDS